MKLMPLTMTAALSIATAGAAVMAESPAGPTWPNTGVAERELVGGDDAWPENMFVEHSNGKWIAWVIASPAHGQTKALDFFSGKVEDVTVSDPDGYADSFVDSRGITHKGTFRPVFYFKDPRPGGAIGNNVRVNVSSLKFGSSVPCRPELEVSERLSGDFKSPVWRKVMLYPDPDGSSCPSVPWRSLIGTGLELRDGTMLVAAGKYVFRVSVDDLTPVGVAPNLHIVDESDVKKVIELSKGKEIKDGSAYLARQLGFGGETPADESNLSGARQRPNPPVSGLASPGALPRIDASQLVGGYLDYIDALKDRSDVSFERLQSAIGSQLRRGEFGSGDASSVYPEGDWISLSFSDGGRAIGSTAILHFGSDRDPNEPLPYCRLSFDDLRDRLLRSGYAEGRQWGELGEVVLWTFSKTDDAWIEVATRWARQSDDLMCVWTIYVRGKA